MPNSVIFVVFLGRIRRNVHAHSSRSTVFSRFVLIISVATDLVPIFLKDLPHALPVSLLFFLCILYNCRIPQLYPVYLTYCSALGDAEHLNGIAFN